MKTKIILSLVMMTISSSSFLQLRAQSCLQTAALDSLCINNVNAIMLNGGDMHRNMYNPGYEIPKGSGLHSIFASSLWIGGIDQAGQLHLAAQTYRQTGNDFWAGPLDTTNALTNAVLAAPYDKVWKLDRMKVEQFSYEWNLGNVQNGTYTPDADILSWPANGSGNFATTLAPYVDVNNNGTYDPLVGGDFPIMRGDQMTYKIFNDECNVHGETGGLPLRTEVHATAYSFSLPNAPDSLEVINNTTLYHYEIYNRSPFQIDSTHIGYWQDVDLGNASDDFVGCNPSGNYGLAFNADSIDEVSNGGYGKRPPILSTVILNGPLADNNDNADNDNDGQLDEPNEQCLMNKFMTYANITPQLGQFYGNPNGAAHFYHYLNSANPISTWPPTTTSFAFPIFPYDSTMWDSLVYASDTRMLISSGPFTFMPGQKVEYDFAIVWSRDTTIPWGTQAYLNRNRYDNQLIQQWFAQNSFPSGLHLAVEETNSENAIAVYPVPAENRINVSFFPKTNRPVYEVVDVMGRTLLVSEKNQIDISQLPSGVYVLRITDGEQQFSKQFVKQ